MQAIDEKTTPKHYLPFVGGFWVIILLLPLVARLFGKKVDKLDSLETIQLVASTYATSRVITKERAGSFIRAPFVEANEDAPVENPVQGEHTKPAGEGTRAVLGELVTCSRCAGLWSAAGLMYLKTLAPEQAKIVWPLLTAAGGNFFLQAKFQETAAKANLLDKKTQEDEPAAFGS